MINTETNDGKTSWSADHADPIQYASFALPNPQYIG